MSWANTYISEEWQYTDSPVKKKFQEQEFEKGVMLRVSWDIKEPITIDFLKKKVPL